MRTVLKSRPDGRLVRRDDRVVMISGRTFELESQYLWLNHFAGLGCVPRVRSFARHGRFGVLVREFVEGTPLHQELLQHPDEAFSSVKLLVAALSALRDRPENAAAPLNFELLRRHYVRGVTRRYATALTWVPCLKAERFTVNGRAVPNPYITVADRADDIVERIARDAEPGPVHGDPNLSNVIRTREGGPLLLVDPPGAFADERALSGDLNHDAARVASCMNGFSDIIQSRGALLRSDDEGFEVEVDVSPVLHLIEPSVVQLLTSGFPVSEEGLVLREGLLYLSAAPLRAPDLFQVHALLARGVERLTAAGLL